MQRKQAAAKTFLRFPHQNKPGFGSAVVTGLHEVPLPGVPGLPFPIDTLTTTNSALSAAIAAAQTGSHAAVAALHRVEKTWNEQFGPTADAVSDWAAGDATKILETGFMPTKAESVPAPLLNAPGFIKAIAGAHAAAVSAAQPDNGHADAFAFIATPVDVTVSFSGANTIAINFGGKVAYITIDTHRGTNMDGLAANVELIVHAVGLNSAGLSPLSEQAAVTPQS